MLSAGLGVAVGVVLGLTGAGGAILSVPLLVFVLHMPMVDAAPVGLLAVALAAGLGAVLGLRAKTLRYKAAALMALTGVIATPFGRALALKLPNTPLMVLFAAVLTFVGIRMLRQAARELRGEADARPANPPCRLDPATGKFHWTWQCARSLGLAGATAGFLSGLLGVGGGFVIVPTLLAVSDLSMKWAVSTSMGVLALVSTGGVIGAALHGPVAWDIAWPFAGGAVAGMLAGRTVAQRVAGPRLQQGFAIFAVLVAASMAIRAAL